MTTNDQNMVKTSKPEGTGGFPEAYIRLRTVLDALEISALRYVLEGKNAATREELAAKAIKVLMHTNEQLSGGICGDGLHNCGGCCVPYPCWESLE